jgi:two-component sensor histidine kinase
MSQTKRANHVDLKNYTIKLSNRIDQSLRKEQKNITLKVHVEDGIDLDMDRAIPFALIINELVMNACMHGFKRGEKGYVVIKIFKSEDKLFLKVTDSGIGLPSNFEQKVAKGIGMRIIRASAKQLNATLDYSSNDNTSFELQISL